MRNNGGRTQSHQSCSTTLLSQAQIYMQRILCCQPCTIRHIDAQLPDHLPSPGAGSERGVPGHSGTSSTLKRTPSTAPPDPTLLHFRTCRRLLTASTMPAPGRRARPSSALTTPSEKPTGASAPFHFRPVRTQQRVLRSQVSRVSVQVMRCTGVRK